MVSNSGVLLGLGQERRWVEEGRTGAGVEGVMKWWVIGKKV